MAVVGNDRNLGDAISVSDTQNAAEEARARRETQKKREEFQKKYHLTEQQLNAYDAKLAHDKALENQRREHEVKRGLLEEQAKYAKKWTDRLTADLQLAAQNTAKFLKSAAAESYKAAVNSVGEYTNLLAQYKSTITARTQGASGKTFQDMYDLIKKNIGASPYVKQTAVLENLSKLVGEGIAFNVEQRAFLNTIKDDIAATFDAANGTLLQLIRIQQADTTAARLGMEAYLTRFLNATFQDTSYLSRGYDTTSAALLAMSSTAGSAQRAAELEFVVQKWLGALAAVGVSDSTLSMLAEGINALGSGDISRLANNTAMQSLLAMASGRGGISYAETLTGGFTASNLNRLLESIVTYGQQIASTSNAVVRNQYAQLFGMSVSDLIALQNLDKGTLSAVSKTTMSYEGMMGELSTQYSQLGSRLHISEMIQNVLDNTLMSIGAGIANNPAKYLTWIVNDLVESATGGINIPAVGVLGNFVDLNANLNQLLKVGLIGSELMGTIGTTLGALFSGKDLLERWGLRTTGVVSRGGRTEVVMGPSVTGLKSSSYYVGNASTSDVYQQSVASATAEAETVKSEEPEDIATIKNNTTITVERLNRTDTNVQSIVELLRSVCMNNSMRVTVIGGGPW